MSKLQQRPVTDHAAPPGRARFGWCLLLVFILCAATGVAAEVAPPSESQVKAACLFSLSKYVEWPAPRFPDKASPIVLGLHGEDRLGNDLGHLVATKLIDNRKVMLNRGAAAAEWRDCHILFISASETQRLPEILSKLNGIPVLTVGESPGFLEHGGIINFVMKERKVRLEVNLAAAEKAGLKISARLLAAADVVKKQ
jgi:hypothetical protein